MRRLLATVLFGVGTVGAIGCAGNATFVQKNPDGSGGVISLKAGGDVSDVQKLAMKEYGPDFEIVGSVQPSIQQTGGFDPSQPKTDPNVMHYQVRKKAKADLTGFPPAPGGGGMPGAGMGTGLPGAGMGMPQSGGFQPGMGGVGMPGMGGDSGFGTGAGQPPAVFPPSK